LECRYQYVGVLEPLLGLGIKRCINLGRREQATVLRLQGDRDRFLLVLGDRGISNNGVKFAAVLLPLTRTNSDFGP
jgi:hypothetical protein